MAEHAVTVEMFNAQMDPTDTETVSLQVPKQFLTMLEFLERKNALDAGREPISAAEVLDQIVRNELHQTLHWLTVEPRISHTTEISGTAFVTNRALQKKKFRSPPRWPGMGKTPSNLCLYSAPIRPRSFA